MKMKKKILIGLFVATCLVVISLTVANNSVIGLNDSKMKSPRVSSTDRMQIGFSKISIPKVDSKNKPERFTNVGFQSFYNPNTKQQCWGYVCDWTNENVYVLTDFFDINGKLYYSNQYGQSLFGLNNINGNIYDFSNDKNDPCAKQGGEVINGDIYYFDDNYKAVMGRKLINGYTYIFNDQGHMEVGWKDIFGKKYYSTKERGLALGWCNLNGHRYFFDQSDAGAAHVGWYDKDPAGKMYFNERGEMADGVVRINGDTYLFTHNGKGENAYQNTGWYTDTKTNKRYYFNPNNGGRAETGVRIIGDYTYLFSNEGVLDNQQLNTRY